MVIFNDKPNYDLDDISKWLICNKLTLNTTKTIKFTLIGSRQKLRTLSESVELSIDTIPT